MKGLLIGVSIKKMYLEERIEIFLKLPQLKMFQTNSPAQSTQTKCYTQNFIFMLLEKQ